MYDKNGDEVDYQWNEGRIGTKNYHEPKLISSEDLVKRFAGPNAKEPVPNELLEASFRKHLHPNKQNVFEVWIDDGLAGCKDM